MWYYVFIGIEIYDYRYVTNGLILGQKSCELSLRNLQNYGNEI